jgi:flagellar hook assembly protein FlgD
VLDQNCPNPFNPSTRISYRLPRAGRVQLSIYSVRGRLVKNLVDRYQAEGARTVTWDGTDDRGGVVPSGMYLYTLRAGDLTETRKMVLLR